MLAVPPPLSRGGFVVSGDSPVPFLDPLLTALPQGPRGGFRMRWTPLGWTVPVFLVLTPIEAPGYSPEPADAPPPGRDPSGLYAIRAPNLFRHNVGLLTLQVTNLGMIGNPYSPEVSAGWHGGEYLFSSGLWVGAIGGDSEPHVSTAIYRDQLEFRPDLDARWTIYESYEGIRGGFRLGAGGTAAADDDGDGLVDEDFHNGLDDDGDGLVDEDFEAIGQQMFSCMYRDDMPEAVSQIPDHVPLGLLVKQRSFQWSASGINEFVGFEFEVVNDGEQRLRDLYIGFFSDSDVGPKAVDGFYDDDLVGWAHIDTTVTDPARSGGCSRIPLVIDTAYMWDAPDEPNRVRGDVSGVFGSLFLGHTTDDTGIRAPQRVGLATVAWFSRSGQTTDPETDEERYLLLSNRRRPSQNARKVEDYRYVIAAGPFSRLDPGQSLVFQTAYVIGDGQTGFRANAVNAQRVFNGHYVNADENPETGTGGRERCLQVLNPGEQISWLDPCDTTDVTPEIFRYGGDPCNVDGRHYVDADCDPCTGVGGAETLLHWLGTTAAPPPNLNTVPARNPDLTVFVSPAADRSVVLQWDNSSELRIDPVTGQRVFSGYRVWRVDNWQRPEGSIGPALEDWRKIAEFWETPGEADQENWEPLFVVRRTDVRPIGKTKDDPPRDIYPVGRYEYHDTAGLQNGKLYFYAVTAFGFIPHTNEITGRMERIELSGLPSAVEAEAVIPRWDAEDGCAKVRVVPNPYRGGAAWDLVPSERDPTGTRIAFRSLPRDDSPVRIRIYTLSGDLVREAEHVTAGGDGTYFWDLVTRSGQNVSSGIYLYTVQYWGGTCRGRFVIIR